MQRVRLLGPELEDPPEVPFGGVRVTPAPRDEARTEFGFPEVRYGGDDRRELFPGRREARVRPAHGGGAGGLEAPFGLGVPKAEQQAPGVRGELAGRLRRQEALELPGPRGGAGA